MDDASIRVYFPLDDGFLRRECPYCRKECKIQLLEQEIRDLASKLEESYLVEESQDREPQTAEEPEEMRTCPYCGQQADGGSWWTQKQLAHAMAHVENLVAEMVNEHFIRPLKRDLKRQTSGPVSVRFEGQELKKKSTWMSPEGADMAVFDLPCCGRRMKIDPGWDGTVHCFFCGFPYSPKGKGEGDRRTTMPRRDG
jgi:hypothetical protein